MVRGPRPRRKGRKTEREPRRKVERWKNRDGKKVRRIVSQDPDDYVDLKGDMERRADIYRATGVMLDSRGQVRKKKEAEKDAQDTPGI